MQLSVLDKAPKPISQEIYNIFSDLKERESRNVDKELLGFSITPFDILNETISGIRPGFYYGIAGAPRRGKTNLTLEVGLLVVKNNKIPVLFYSWEQTRKVLVSRLLSKKSGIPPAVILGENIYKRPELREKLSKAKEELSEIADWFYMIEAGRMHTIPRIREDAMRIMDEKKTDKIAIFIDYLQKVPPEKPVQDMSYRIDDISAGLAELSLELESPVFAISSLNKEGLKLDEMEDDSRPTMHHCTGSGDLEYDLDVAMVLSKDWLDTKSLKKQIDERLKAQGIDPYSYPMSRIDIINMFIDKNRDAIPGISDTIQYLFFIDQNMFLEVGYKLPIEMDPSKFNRYVKIEKIIDNLIDRGLIFQDLEEWKKKNLKV